MSTPPTAKAELYPECEKLKDVSDDSQKIGEFLSWLETNHTICKIRDSESECCSEPIEIYSPMHTTIEQLLADYFDIDLDKVEKERTAILASIRK